MSNLHWDYAESFSGRDAAYLIAGFDPSSNSAEDAYRVQHVIKRLKKAYYFACSKIRKDINPDRDSNFWGWLHNHEYDKAELLSVEMEAMIRNFNSSEVITKGLLQKLEEEDKRDRNDFPDRSRQLQLESAKAGLQANRNQLFQQVDEDTFDKLVEVNSELQSSSEQHSKNAVTWNAYFALKTDLEVRYKEFFNILDAKARKVNASYDAELEMVNRELGNLAFEQSDWRDNKAAEVQTLVDESWPYYFAAVKEADDWGSADSHEFDDQRFSRDELQRWIMDNAFQSAYKFAQMKVASSDSDGVQERPIKSNERNTLLLIIAALAQKAGIDPDHHKSASAISAAIESLGASVSGPTVREKLDMIPAAIAQREVVAPRKKANKT